MILDHILKVPDLALILQPDEFNADFGREFVLTRIAVIALLWPSDPRMFSREQSFALLAGKGEGQERSLRSPSEAPWVAMRGTFPWLRPTEVRFYLIQQPTLPIVWNALRERFGLIL